MEETLILRTTVSNELLGRVLKKGSLWALIGVGLLVYTGAFASLSLLKAGGFALFISGFALIALGLLPYRRLSRLQSKPHELHCCGLEKLDYYINGQKVLTIPLSAIDRLAYDEQMNSFGIAFWLKRPVASKVIVSSHSFNLSSFRKQASVRHADAFFPYFSRRSFEELNEWLFCKEED